MVWGRREEEETEDMRKRSHRSSYAISMKEALKALDMSFPSDFFWGKAPMLRKYLKTVCAYWGIICFTFYADILKLVYHLHRSRDHRDQSRIQSVAYNENGRCCKGRFLKKIYKPPFKFVLTNI